MCAVFQVFKLCEAVDLVLIDVIAEYVRVEENFRPESTVAKM